MDGTWKENRIVLGLLLLAVVGVWGTVLYQVTTGVTAPTSGSVDSSEAQVESFDSDIEPRSTVDAYEGRFRDPFMPALGGRRTSASSPPPSNEPAESEPTQNEAPSATPPIRVQLIGVVEKTVLLQDGGTTHLAAEGDSVSLGRGTIEIQAVVDERVVLTRGDRTDTLTLPRPEWENRLRSEN